MARNKPSRKVREKSKKAGSVCKSHPTRDRFYSHTVLGEMWVRRADAQGVLRDVRRGDGEEGAGRKMRRRQEIQRHEELHRRGGVQR